MELSQLPLWMGWSFLFAINLDVIHPPLSMSIGEILKKLSETGLPYLYLPSEESFVLVDALPVLGTGKLDLKGMQQLAFEKHSTVV